MSPSGSHLSLYPSHRPHHPDPCPFSEAQQGQGADARTSHSDPTPPPPVTTAAPLMEAVVWAGTKVTAELLGVRGGILPSARDGGGRGVCRGIL